MTSLLSRNNWFMRYRLYHIPVWAIYSAAWWAITIGSVTEALHSILFTTFGVKFCFYLFFQLIAVYVTLYVLMPRLLEKRRTVTFVSALLLLIVAVSFCIIPGYYISASLSEKTVQQYYGADTCWYHFLGNALSSTMTCLTLAMSIKLGRNWIQTQRREQALEKEKLESELTFLKYQFNPHFLFNTINSIFFLIHKNPDMASSSLAKFSDLLRYQLYECDDKQIPLGNEVAYLQNFIELEKLRQNKNMEIRVDLDLKNNANAGIAPFILMTFVENAFKHVSKNSEAPNRISLSLYCTGQQLDFALVNTVPEEIPAKLVDYGGIGLKNVRRRLELIYPGRYQLDTGIKDGLFEVRFQLLLTGIPVAGNLLQTA